MVHAEPAPEGCVVTFGAIADVQYWDGDDAYNFAKVPAPHPPAPPQRL